MVGLCPAASFAFYTIYSDLFRFLIYEQISPAYYPLVTGLTGARAQYDSQLSQYFMALGYYNPAYAGVTGDLNMLAMSRLQYVGIDGAPTSFFINADMPLKIGKTNHGVGMVVFTEGIGLFVNTHVNLQYAYKQKLFGGTLSIGMQFGMVNQSFDGEKVFYPTSQFHQQEDQAIPKRRQAEWAST